MKRFVILLDTCTKEQEEAVRVYIKGQGVAWWHWIPGVWLVRETAGTLNAKKLRDDLLELLPGLNTLVLEFSDAGEHWSGFGPNTGKRHMFKWLQKHWKKPE